MTACPFTRWQQTRQRSRAAPSPMQPATPGTCTSAILSLSTAPHGRTEAWPRGSWHSRRSHKSTPFAPAARRASIPRSSWRCASVWASTRSKPRLRHRQRRVAVTENERVAYDEDLAGRIRELIGGEKALSEKRMFGGLAFLIGGNMAISASGQGGLLVRVDPAKSDQLTTGPHVE